jgi:hypothetical protein
VKRNGKRLKGEGLKGWNLKGGCLVETVQLTVSKFNVLNFDYERRQRRV